MAYPYEAANSYDAANGKQNIEQKNTAAYLSAVGATQLKTGAGFLDGYFGVAGTGALNIYDLAAGTTASLANQIAQIPAWGTAINGGTGVIPPIQAAFHVQYNNGLFLNTVSTATVATGTLAYT